MRAPVLLGFALLAASCRADAKRPLAPAPSQREAAIIEEVPLAIGEASAVVALPGRRFLIADDDRGVQLVVLGSAGPPPVPAAVSLLAALADLEGLTRVGDRFLAVEEDSGVVWDVALDGERKRLGVLARPPAAGKMKKNKGFEGLAFLPAARAGDKRDHLLAVHEGAPKAVVVFAWPALTLDRVIALEGTLNDRLDDLSDLAIDPATGDLLLLSDESRKIARVRLSDTLVVVGFMDLPLTPREKPEGLAFDDQGSLWVVTDAPQRGETGRLFRVAFPPER